MFCECKKRYLTDAVKNIGVALYNAKEVDEGKRREARSP